MTAPLENGTPFAGRYRIERRLGEGGMGAVYAAFDEEVGERVAIKVLTRELAEHPAAIQRFQREVRFARRITHPHVARTHDLGRWESTVFLTMELVDGETLQDRLAREGPLRPGEALRIGVALAEGLAAAHGVGVLHRDLKSANVMLERTGRVVLTDFGVAGSILGEVGDGLRTVGLVGTPRYLPPEVLDGHPHGERSDLYALGAVLVEALTGQPFKRSEGDALEATPASVRELVQRLLADDAEARPPSALDAAQALSLLRDDYADDVDTVAPVTSPFAPSAPPDGTWGRPLPHGDALAVMPFAARGDQAGELAEVLTEELVDVLSRNAGLRVIAHRATKVLPDEDLTAAGRRLGARWVVSGSAMRRGPRVRISVRLMEVDTGAQHYAERFDAQIVDLFDVQDRIALRIGEALRLETDLVTRRGSADERAVEHYLRGRRKLTSPETDPGAGFEELEAAVARAPDFAVAVAAHAVASVQRWFVLDSTADGPDAEKAMLQSLTRALEIAPDIAETHLALAKHAAQRGSFAEAREALDQALDIAPTCATALDYLGQLECEAGRGERGAERIELASELDPRVVDGQIWRARWHAFQGRRDQASRILDDLDAREGGPSVNRTQLRMRIAAWHGDVDVLRELRRLIPTWRFARVDRLVEYADVLLGERPANVFFASIDELLRSLVNPRIGTYLLQIATEASALRGRPDLAHEGLSRASRLALVDLDWLDRCPALRELRASPAFDEARRRVEVRAEAIWRR